MAVDSSGHPGCWLKPLSASFLHLRRTGLPGSRTGQERWPGQVALVSSCRRPPHGAMPPGSLHATRYLGLVSCDAGADRWAQSHGNRWLPPPCLPALLASLPVELRLQRDQDINKRGPLQAGRGWRLAPCTWTWSGICPDVQPLHVSLSGVSSYRLPREHAAAGSPPAPRSCPTGQHLAGKACQDRGTGPSQRDLRDQRVSDPSLGLASPLRVSSR